jgi:hypothetical protein
MASVYIPLVLRAFDAVPGVTAPTPALETSIVNGVIADRAALPYLGFPPRALTAAYWVFTSLIPAGGGDVPIAISPNIFWYGSTPSTGNVQWGTQVAVTNGNGNGQGVYDKALSPAGFTVTSYAGVAGAMRVTSPNTTDSRFFTTNAPYCIAIKIFRNGANLTVDTYPGEVRLTGVTVIYSDT